MKRPQKKRIEFDIVLNVLVDDQQTFPPAYYRSFSDITPENLSKLRSIWGDINPKRKEILLEELINLAENDTEVLFDDIGRLALTDNTPTVRTAGIRLLWECNDVKLVPQFLSFVKNDPDAGVRAAAATALGLFVYLGELEEIDQNLYDDIVDSLLSVINGDDQASVKRRALEGLGFKIQDDIYDHINKAFTSGDKEWMASALFAMSRSADSNEWKEAVISTINHPILSIQYEAIQAAGMLELEDARQPLLDMIEMYDDIDENIRMAVVTALSRIGGEDVEETLEALVERVEDEEEIEVIEDALEYISFFHNGSLPMGMFDFSESIEETDLLQDLDEYTNSEDQDEDSNDIEVSNT